MSEIFYRYEIKIGGSPVDPNDPWRFGTDLFVYVKEFPVIRRTPCGVWLRVGLAGEKWTNTTCRKRYAHETKEAALEAFLARRRKQRCILHDQIKVCRKALRVAEKNTDELLKNGVARTTFERW